MTGAAVAVLWPLGSSAHPSAPEVQGFPAEIWTVADDLLEALVDLSQRGETVFD